MKNSPERLNPIPDTTFSVPKERLVTYARLWEFETWLRTMVYVELKCAHGDAWEAHLHQGAKSERHKKGDSYLSHMPTRETLKTSYMQLTDLLTTISDQWELFKPYLPPKKVWEGKLHEVKQIRNRIAHFRMGHRHDASRVEQFLRDIDQGFWRFCTSYNSDCTIVPESKDPVIKRFLHLDPFPWTEVEPGTWGRVGIAPANLRMSVSFNVVRRPWLVSPSSRQIAGEPGYFYDARFFARNRGKFNFGRFFSSTQRLHPKLCHICLDHKTADSIRVTVPSVLGASSVVQVFKQLITAAEDALRSGLPRSPSESFPEYVLGATNPLTFLSPDMACSFFNID